MPFQCVPRSPSCRCSDAFGEISTDDILCQGYPERTATMVAPCPRESISAAKSLMTVKSAWASAISESLSSKWALLTVVSCGAEYKRYPAPRTTGEH